MTTLLFLYNNKQFLINFYLGLIDIISLLYYILKIYKSFCLTSIILSFFLIINPYRYPFYFIKKLTIPFFSFCASIFYPIKFKMLMIKTTDILGILILNYLSLFCLFCQNILKQKLINLISIKNIDFSIFL